LRWQPSPSSRSAACASLSHRTHCPPRLYVMRPYRSHPRTRRPNRHSRSHRIYPTLPAQRPGREQMLFVEPGRQALGDSPQQTAPAAARRDGCLRVLTGERDTAVGQSDAALLAPAGMAEGAARSVQAEAAGKRQAAGAERPGGGAHRLGREGGMGHRLRSYI